MPVEGETILASAGGLRARRPVEKPEELHTPTARSFKVLLSQMDAPNLTSGRFHARNPVMTTVTATKARGSLYALINEVRESHEPIQITGKQGNAVLISEEDWRSIRETLFLHSIPDLVDSIKRARTEGLEQASSKLDW